LDIATANKEDISASVLLGVGNRTFRSTVSYPTGSQVSGSVPTSVAIGDLNGDKLIDIAITNEDKSVNVLGGNREGRGFHPSFS
jgi:hypothetical protein